MRRVAGDERQRQPGALAAGQLADLRRRLVAGKAEAAELAAHRRRLLPGHQSAHMLQRRVIAAQFLVAVLYTPLMLRLLGQAEYGLYSLVSSIVSYLTLLSFGFAGAYMRFYARFRVADDRDGVRRLNGIFFTVFATMGLVAAAGGTLLSAN